MTPQIIRTLTDLESIDPDTILSDSAGPYTADDAVDAIYEADDEDRDYLPAVVIATGDETRAAMQALKEVK